MEDKGFRCRAAKKVNLAFHLILFSKKKRYFHYNQTQKKKLKKKGFSIKIYFVPDKNKWKLHPYSRVVTIINVQ